jgi:hypothetical protein
VAKNCTPWGPKCQRAKDDQARTEAKLASARSKLEKQSVVLEDALTARLVAWFGWRKAEIQFFEPLLLPLCVLVFGSLANSVAFGPHHKPAGRPVEPAKPEPMVEVEAPRPGGWAEGA